MDELVAEWRRVEAEDAIRLLREILPWAAGAEMRAALLGGGAGGGDLEWLAGWIARARAVVAQMEVRNDVG